jgi:hypothetical protein
VRFGGGQVFELLPLQNRRSGGRKTDICLRSSRRLRGRRLRRGSWRYGTSRRAWRKRRARLGLKSFQSVTLILCGLRVEKWTEVIGAGSFLFARKFLLLQESLRALPSRGVDF